MCGCGAVPELQGRCLHVCSFVGGVTCVFLWVRCVWRLLPLLWVGVAGDLDMRGMVSAVDRVQGV